MRFPRFAPTAGLVLIVLALTGTLAGCGRKGDLEAPATTKNSAANKQTDAATQADAAALSTVPEAGKLQRVPGGKVKVPNQPFFLDQIL